jgi:hypothetical protein
LNFLVGGGYKREKPEYIITKSPTNFDAPSPAVDFYTPNTPCLFIWYNTADCIDTVFFINGETGTVIPV